MMPATAWQELERSLGRERIQSEPAVVAPASVEEAIEVMGWAARHHLTVVTNGPAAASSVRLDLGRLQRMRFHEPGDLTLGVDAGMTVDDLQKKLLEAGQFLPLDVAAADRTTLGAVLDFHCSGVLRHGYGTVRDFVIGIEAITADGTLIHGGGKVVKNVAGYDVMKLLIGSRGTLAIITGVHFRVFPLPGVMETLALGPLDWKQAEATRQWLQRSFLHPLAFELCRRRQDDGMRALIRFTGRESVRARYRREVREWAERLGAGCEACQGEADLHLWAGLQEFPALEEGVSTLRLSAPPARAIDLLATLQRRAESEGYALEFLGRLGLGAFSLRIQPVLQPSICDDWRRLVSATGDAWLQVEPGSYPQERWADGAPGLELMRRIKHDLDPEGRLNPQWSLADV